MKNLDNLARAILQGNDKGAYTIPTSGLYPYQWNWDSVLAAWGFATFDIDRAWTELETLFQSQWASGMVPHIIFHEDDPGYFPGPQVWGTGQTPPTSGISQPPVAATIAAKVWGMDPDAGRERIAKLFPKMLAWHRWYHEVRCMHGPATITHPWESGRDNCPDWDIGMAGVDGSKVAPYERRDTGHVDPEMRPKKEEYDKYVAILEFGRDVGWDDRKIMEEGPFLMADPAMTFILLRADKDLLAMAEKLGEDTAEIQGWIDDLTAAVPSLWNDDLGSYDASDIRSGAWANNISSGAFLYTYAGIDNPAMDKRTLDAWDAVTYGIPSADPKAERFDPQRYWRGPSWPFMNGLIAIGLQDAGRDLLAERLRRETAELIRKGGFYEYFDPTNGSPCGGSDFTWTAAVWLAWAGRT
ncbi:hypothetical protein SAMN05444003_2885 [Cognatiyoonia sediminum]|uniref:Mannosylglycerate hydrolase MGH1-like glycoside hydrolase domain-containing protein n=1 Tax=Cognatiyoonia sediminum TaxID=1508389 RepID=A0A1M5SBU5_9RHOB|nr:hypothetical protein [Cognatiyoonia sediminum]SHH35949.1 hypothetical protein SAMN05444003_2885 [Cognatiyoonia sediminum]